MHTSTSVQAPETPAWGEMQAQREVHWHCCCRRKWRRRRRRRRSSRKGMQEVRWFGVVLIGGAVDCRPCLLINPHKHIDRVSTGTGKFIWRTGK
eukprot:1159201-Pelagomonas_calceolata.AAC.11